MEDAVTIRALSPKEAVEQIGALSRVLIDCVEGGASVSFMLPMTQDKADTFWRGVADGVAAGERILLVAEMAGEIVGTVQVVLKQPENQPHRADIAKMLVHRKARRRGVGAALMRAAEEAARKAGKSVLVLDTVTGSDAERLYTRLGWERVGVIPNYALWPQGGLLPDDLLPQADHACLILAARVPRAPCGNPRTRSRFSLERRAGHRPWPSGESLLSERKPGEGVRMASKDFIRQMEGYGLTTAKILYRMPDHPTLLQTYIWQEYDLAPRFPVLIDFLEFWKRELAGPLHSVTITHARLIRPAEFRAVSGEINIH